MPELPEVEAYRVLAERAALGRAIAAVHAADSWYLKRGTTSEALDEALVGERFTAARRRGKLLLLDVGGGAGAVLGLRFGMTGRLLVDGVPGVDRLLHSPAGSDTRFERFAVDFHRGGRLVVSDPRRLGGVELDPDETLLGPDAITVTQPELRAALAGGRVALKARLMDQARIAGVGNLLADEILWRAGLAPARPAGELTSGELRRLHTHLTGGIADLIGRGGSHTGDFMPERRRGGACPKDGAPISRAVVGGRATYWCPHHQR